MKRFELNPNETAQENLWRACRNASASFINKKTLRLTSDEKHDIIADVTIAAVFEFMRRLRLGKYNRSVSFYLNCWSCAYAKYNWILQCHIEQIKEKISAVSLESAMTEDGKRNMAEVIPCESAAPLRNYKNKKDYKGHVTFEAARRQCDRVRAVNEMYDDYVEECLTLGVTPQSADKFRQVNGYQSAKPSRQHEWKKKAAQSKKDRRMEEYLRWMTDPEYTGLPGRK